MELYIGGINLNKVYIIGDVHGSVHPIKKFIRRNKDRQFDYTDTLILLGDSGLNYHLDE